MLTKTFTVFTDQLKSIIDTCVIWNVLKEVRLQLPTTLGE